MNSNDLNEKLTFIIVDNNIGKILMIRKTLGELGVQPLVISKKQYRERTLLAAKEAHEQGKLPVIFLNEYFGTNESESGSLILFALSESLKDPGGILFPTSPFYGLQLEKWSEVLEEENHTWYIERELNPVLENFNSMEISRVCNKFLSSIDSREQGGEIKNG
ncbi:MAG: hypothetical protein WC981_01170 [Candidatus Dojkabacteria bacterium]|jgi:hypothetical protein